MRTHLPTLVMMALAGYCSQASAQERCPELTRLRSEAAEAIKPMPSVVRCGAHHRFSRAWGAIVQYANDHRELCDISIGLLSSLRNSTARQKKRATMSARAALFAHIHQMSLNVDQAVTAR